MKKTTYQEWALDSGLRFRQPREGEQGKVLQQCWKNVTGVTVSKEEIPYIWLDVEVQGENSKMLDPEFIEKAIVEERLWRERAARSML